jgi:hypothetical protein
MVTEAYKGQLSQDGNLALECKSTSWLDCKGYNPSRYESRF